MSPAEIRRDLLQEKTAAFNLSPLFVRVFALAEKAGGEALPRQLMPQNRPEKPENYAQTDHRMVRPPRRRTLPRLPEPCRASRLIPHAKSLPTRQHALRRPPASPNKRHIVNPLLISGYTATTSLGHGLDALLAGLREGRSGLQACTFETVRLDTWIGEVAAVDAEKLPKSLARYDCRNNRLAQLRLEADGFAERVRAAIARYGRSRVGVFLGTSTSGILQTELAYRRRDPVSGALPDDFIYRTTHNSFSLAEFTRDYFGLEGPAMAISTACSSSAKVFAAPPANWPAAASMRRWSAASIRCA
jgi:hypothetical protein